MLSASRATVAMGSAVVVLLMAACAPASPTAAPTSPPAKPTTPPAAAPTTAPAAAAKPTEAPKPAAAKPTDPPAKPADKPAEAAKPAPAAKPAVDVAAARIMVASKGCGGCHIIPGVDGATGTVGPDLTGVAGRQTIAGGAVPHRNQDDMKAWLLNPPGLKPGTQMPPLGLTDAEATTIAAFLETLN